MAKATTKGGKEVTKKEFEWYKETEVKVIEVNKYENRVLKVCELNKKQFVTVTTMKKIKDEWKPVKNASFPMDVWKEMVEAMGDFELQAAFGSTQELKAPAKPKKGKKEEPKLKGKKPETSVHGRLMSTYKHKGIKKIEAYIYRSGVGTYTAVTPDQTKEYKTQRGAEGFLIKNDYEFIK